VSSATVAPGNVTGYRCNMKERLQSDLKAAMKARDSVRLMTIRGILAEITRVEKETRHEATDAEIVTVLKRERARRDEAIGFARQGNRQELVNQYEAEAKVLDGYIPAAAGEDEVRAAIDSQIKAGARQIGPIMKALRDQFGTRLDGKMASELIKSALSAA
jgi:uncharacterized protein YqeY